MAENNNEFTMSNGHMEQTTSTIRHESSRKRSLSEINPNVQEQTHTNKRQRYNQNNMRLSTNSAQLSQTIQNNQIQNMPSTCNTELLQTIQNNQNQTDNTNSALSSSSPIQYNEHNNHNHNHLPSVSNMHCNYNNHNISSNATEYNGNRNNKSDNHNNKHVSSQQEKEEKALGFSTTTSSPKIIIRKLKSIGRWDGATFTIRVKCTTISVRTNKKKESWFYAIVMDDPMTEKKVNFWSQHFERKDEIYKGGVFEIFGLQTKFTDPQYQRYGAIELQCTPNTKIKPYAVEPNHKLATLSQIWNFVLNIAAIPKQKPNALFDVIGIVKSWDEIEYRNTKYGLIPVRRVVIFDKTGIIKVNVWGKQADLIFKQYQIIALKNCKSSSYHGLTISPTDHVEQQPDCTAADDLRDWLAMQNPTLNLLYSKLLNISDGAHTVPGPDYTKIKHISVNEAYATRERYRIHQRMPDKNLLKIYGIIADIQKAGKDLFYKKEGKTFWGLKIIIKDINSNANIPAVCFEEVAKQIMNGLTGVKAAELRSNDPTEFAKLMMEVINKEQKAEFSIRCRENSYHGRERKVLEYIIDKFQHC